MIAAERQVRRMRYALFGAIMHQEMGWFDTLNPGQLSNRLVTDLGMKKLSKDSVIFTSGLWDNYF